MICDSRKALRGKNGYTETQSFGDDPKFGLAWGAETGQSALTL
jgi:hypothetical protein